MPQCLTDKSIYAAAVKTMNTPSDDCSIKDSKINFMTALLESLSVLLESIDLWFGMLIELLGKGSGYSLTGSYGPGCIFNDLHSTLH